MNWIKVAPWRKRLGTHLSLLGTRVRVSVTSCGFRMYVYLNIRARLHLRSLAPVWNYFFYDYDGQWYRDGWGLSFSDICLTVEEKNPQPGKLTRPGIEPGPARWEATMLSLDHSGGHGFRCGRIGACVVFSRGFSLFPCHKFHSTISPYSLHSFCFTWFQPPCDGPSGMVTGTLANHRPSI